MANFTASVTFNSDAGQFLVGGALSLTQTKGIVFTKDTAYGNIYIAANQTQSIYESSDVDVSVAPITYIYAQASTTNTNPVSVFYKTGSNNVALSKLAPGEWMFVPLSSGAATSSSLLAVAGASPASLAILYAESGSI